MLPPTCDEPFDAKSTGQVSPSAAACSCTASVTAPACTRTVSPSSSIGSMRRMRASDTTSSPCAATAPPARPVRPPDGTTGTRWALHSASSRATSSVVRGNAIADGSGAYTRVQSRPYSARSAASSVQKSAGKSRAIAARNGSGNIGGSVARVTPRIAPDPRPRYYQSVIALSLRVRPH